jgi:UDP-galactopyranose mutase
MKYNYLVVGAGPFGAVFAHEAHKQGKSVLVIDRRNHVGGNLYCENKDDITIHVYGAHIFHTSLRHVWDYVNQFVEFNHYVNSPIASYKGEIYNLPFNMNTFSKMWNISTPKEAAMIISEQRRVVTGNPENLEEQAISLVGTDIYEKLIKGYTEKQWGRKCTELPAFIIKRLPVRYTYDNNYFNDPYQGIPKGGYTKMIEHMLDGIEVRLDVDFIKERDDYAVIVDKIIYTGSIDEYFGYTYGPLAYRGLKFETARLEEENHQGVAVVNYTDAEVPYTRSIEHKHFEFGTQPVTYVTREYPEEWRPGGDAYYPVNDDKNRILYERYKELAKKEPKVIFGGRLGEYKYYDMDKTIAGALKLAEQELRSVR